MAKPPAAIPAFVPFAPSRFRPRHPIARKRPPPDVSRSITELSYMTRTIIARIATAVACALFLAASAATAQEDLNSLLQQANDTYRAGNYRLSAEKGKKALALAEKQLSPDHVDVATILNNLGMAYVKMNDMKTAEPLFKRALGILEKKLPADDPKIAITLENMLNIYWGQKRYKELEPALKRLITIYRKQGGPRLPDALNGLASMYLETNRRAEATPLFLESLPLLEAAGKDRRDQLASALHALGAIQDADGNADSSVAYYERALAIREAIGDSTNAELAATLNNLGRSYALKGSYDKAEPLMKRAIAIIEKLRGLKDPQTKAMMGNLASVYDMLNRTEDAAALRKRAGIEEH